MLAGKEIIALIQLLDDPDKEVFSHVSERIQSIGPGIIPSLEHVWESNSDPLLQKRIENLIRQIQLQELESDFLKWKREDPENLLSGFFLLSRFQYPNLDFDTIKRKIDLIRRDIWLEFHFKLTTFEQANIFNQVFYEKHRFSGNPNNLFDPQFYFLNLMLDSKKGNPLSIGALYIILARSLELPIYGVDIKNHFALTFCRHFLEDVFNDPNRLEELRKETIFYINPVNKGVLFTRNEIKEYTEKMNYNWEERYTLPCSNFQVVLLLLNGLLEAYEAKKDHEKAEELKPLIAKLSEE